MVELVTEEPLVIVATRQHPIHAQLRALDGGTMAMLSRSVVIF